MKSITLPSLTLLCVDVPEGATELEVYESNLYWLIGEDKSDSIPLPPGPYKILGRLDEIDEVEAKGIVEHVDLMVNGKSEGIKYKDYEQPNDLFEWFRNPLDSLNSLMRLNNIFVTNPIGEKPKIPAIITDTSGWEDGELSRSQDYRERMIKRLNMWNEFEKLSFNPLLLITNP